MIKIKGCRVVLKFWITVVCIAASSIPFGTSAAVIVHDDLGNRVELDQPAKRIVALAPHITETLFAAGGGKQVVGTVSYSDFPEAAKTIALVGSYKTINEEALLALKPDLVVAWQSGNGPQMIKRLKRLGLTVYISEPRRLEDIAKALTRLGILSGHERESALVGRRFLEELALLRSESRGLRPVSVFYQVWDKPLQTLNGEHLISDVIRVCGGRNIFENAIALAPHVNLESLLVEDPEAIVASGMGVARPEWLDDWRKWPSLQAVQQDHLYFIPPDLVQRHTPRILLGTRMMCEHLNRVRGALPGS